MITEHEIPNWSQYTIINVYPSDADGALLTREESAAADHWAIYASDTEGSLVHVADAGDERAALTAAAFYAEQVAIARGRAPKCMWFLQCSADATGTTHHPILGHVLTCDRCHKFATGADR